LIHPVAKTLKIPTHRVYANNLIFDAKGDYLGFDALEFTCKDGGKAAAIEHIKMTTGLSPIVHVGDGVTDMQARPPADAFIGFGGVVPRQAVQDGSDWFITDFEVMLSNGVFYLMK
jgi:phosphoserine phosphatase